MNRKGQAEIVVIVALLVIVLVVVAVQMGLFIPGPVSPDVRAARDTVEGFIRTAVLDTIDTMSRRGGYLSPNDYQLGSVILNDEEVPYWQFSGQVTYPDMVSNFQAGLKAYLEANKDGISGALPDLTLGDPVVGIPTFTSSKVTVSVTMPTTYKETPISQPYTVSVETHFSEIFEFSREFAKYDAANRPFEYFTLSTMVLSPMENGHHVIPIYEVLVGCDDYFFASSADVIPEVDKSIINTLANTFMPGKVPLNTMRTSTSPKYTLVPLNGKDYENLEVHFMLPDYFELDFSNFRMSPDPASGTTEPIPLIGDCISPDPIEVKYSMEYPAIVRTRDPETGSIFQYAVHVKIVDNLPGGWSDTLPEAELQAQICSNPTCSLDLTVEDSSGSPIEAASVKFMGCFLGSTDSSGSLTGLAPCGAGSLQVVKRGYSEHLSYKNSGDLQDITITLSRMPHVNLILHEVIVQDYGGGHYMVLYGDILPIVDKKTYLTFRPSSDLTKEYNFYTDSSSLTISTLPAGDYMVAATLTSTDFQSIYGALGSVYELTEELQGDNVHVYIPTNLLFESITDSTVQREKVAVLSQVLHECGIGPITETPYVQEAACSVNIT